MYQVQQQARGQRRGWINSQTPKAQNCPVFKKADGAWRGRYKIDDIGGGKNGKRQADGRHPWEAEGDKSDPYRHEQDNP